jgi:hypothetical protein
MGQDPDLIRRDIEQTRERMGDTVDALGYKADVKSRAKESVTGRVDTVKEKLVGAKETVVGAKDSAMEGTPSTEDVKQGAQRAAGVAQENPLGLAIGSLAIGFLAGMLIPSTRVEDEKIGPVADQVMDRVKETGQEALERGKQVAGDAAQAAKDSAQEQTQDVREHASS